MNKPLCGTEAFEQCNGIQVAQGVVTCSHGRGYGCQDKRHKRGQCQEPLGPVDCCGDLFTGITQIADALIAAEPTCYLRAEFLQPGLIAPVQLTIAYAAANLHDFHRRHVG